eukprot:265427-Chlamydomonas_euryale.AAC.2
MLLICSACAPSTPEPSGTAMPQSTLIPQPSTPSNLTPPCCGAQFPVNRSRTPLLLMLRRAVHASQIAPPPCCDAQCMPPMPQSTLIPQPSTPSHLTPHTSMLRCAVHGRGGQRAGHGRRSRRRPSHAGTHVKSQLAGVRLGDGQRAHAQGAAGGQGVMKGGAGGQGVVQAQLEGKAS